MFLVYAKVVGGFLEQWLPISFYLVLASIVGSNDLDLSDKCNLY